jgi:hypothetical protein
LRAVAVANASSVSAICETLAHHQIEDESLAMAFAESLKDELQDV